MTQRSAAFPWRDGRPPHLPCGPGDVPVAVLMPGDPDRVVLAAPILADATPVRRKREFAYARGTWDGMPIALCSTGIGGPSTEIATVELAGLGARHLVRVGGMGAVDPSLDLGTFVIVTQAIGATGAAGLYRASDAPLAATPAIVAALVQAAKQLRLPHALGIIHTTDSYYVGQGRVTTPDADPDRLPTRHLLDDLAKKRVAGMDMETETLFAVGHALGVSVGAVLAVHGHRATDRWLEDYEPVQVDLIRLAATAMSLMTADQE